MTQTQNSLLFLKCHEGMIQLVQAQSVTKTASYCCHRHNFQEIRTLLLYLLTQVTYTPCKHHMRMIKLLQREVLLPKDTESVNAILKTPLASHTKSNIPQYPLADAKASCPL